MGHQRRYKKLPSPMSRQGDSLSQAAPANCLPCEVYLCTAIRARGWQLERVMAHNLLCMMPHRHHVTWVIAFCSLEDMEDAKLAAQRASGCSSFCKVLCLNSCRPWHASKCKNASHPWALEYHAEHFQNEQAFIINLDGENAISTGSIGTGSGSWLQPSSRRTQPPLARCQVKTLCSL